MKYTDFEKFLSGSKISHLYLLIGTEQFLKHEALAAIKKHLGKPDQVFFKEYNGDALEVEKFWDDVYSQPLFEDRNLIILHTADAVFPKRSGARKKTADDDAPESSAEDQPEVNEKPTKNVFQQRLEEYLGKPPPYSSIVLEMEKALPKKVSDLAKDAVLVECNELRADSWTKGRPSEVMQWVSKRIVQYHKKISAPALALLVDYIGSNLMDLDAQLQKLATYLGSRETIEEADIEAMVPASRKMNMFAFLDAVWDGDKAKATQMLYQMFDRGIEAEGRLLMKSKEIAQQVIYLSRVKLVQLWKSSVTKDLSVHPFIQSRIAAQASAFTPQHLAMIWRELLTADLEVKRSDLNSAESQVAIQKWMQVIWQYRKKTFS